MITLLLFGDVVRRPEFIFNWINDSEANKENKWTSKKSNPTVGRNGKKVGRPAECSSFSIEYHIRNREGLHQKCARKLLYGYTVLAREDSRFCAKKCRQE